LRPILRRMGAGALVLEYLAEITAMNPAAADWVFDQVLGFVFR
jgi:hypothetical protein